MRWSAFKVVRVVGLAAALAGAAVPSGGAAQTPSARPAAADEKRFEEAKTAFEALPEADRRAVQDALVWTGDYNGTTAGGFGRRTFDGIVAFQRRAKKEPTGRLDDKQRADLEAAAEKARSAVKFSLLVDAPTSARIGVPVGLLTKKEANQAGGTRWQSADGKITLDTRSLAGGETELAALYERNLAIQAPGRQVTYKLQRPDFWVVTGETSSGKFYTRYAAGPGGIRAFSIGYDKSATKTFDKLVIAIANSFVPFPATGAPVVADAAPTPPHRPPVAVLAPVPRPAWTGLVIGARRVLAPVDAETCADLRAGLGKARVVKADKAAGLLLLETDAEQKVPTLALRGGQTAGGDAIALFIAGRPREVVLAPAVPLSTGRVIAGLQPGASGGAVLDRSGAILGLIGKTAMPARVVAGVVPPTEYPLVKAEDIARFLQDAGLRIPEATSSARRSAGEIAGALASALVPLACGT